MRPSFAQSPIYFKNPDVKVLSNTVIAAVDSGRGNNDNYPHVISSTIPNDFNEYVYLFTDYFSEIPVDTKLCLGIPIPNINQFNNVVCQVMGSIAFYGQVAPSSYFAFGKTSASSITQSDVAAANLMKDNCIILPGFRNGVASGQVINAYCKEDIVIRKDVTDNNPYIFYIVLENHQNNVIQLDGMRLSLSTRVFNSSLDVYSPTMY